jgi:hypothetical protein
MKKSPNWDISFESATRDLQIGIDLLQTIAKEMQQQGKVKIHEEG